MNIFSFVPFRITLETRRLKDTVNGHCAEPLGPRDFWHWTVAEYGSHDLTKPLKDKLNALSGVAQRLARLWRDEYLAGLFRNDLLWGLLCTIIREKTKDAIA